MTNKRRRRNYKPDATELKERRLKKKEHEAVRKPILQSMESGGKRATATKLKRTGRIRVHFYGWQIFRRHMKSASEFRVVLPYPLSNEEILKRVERAFGDLV